MLKVIGIILTVAVSSAVGLRAAARLTARYKKLQSFCAFIDEIADRMRLGEELERIYKSPAAKGLLLSDGYNAAVIREGITNEDADMLDGFFKTLGMGDTESCVSRCTLFSEIVKKEAAKAENEMNSKSRLYSLLGLLGGIFIAIILI